MALFVRGVGSDRSETVVYLSFSENLGWFWAPYQGDATAYLAGGAFDDGAARAAIDVARRCVKPWYCRPRVESLRAVFCENQHFPSAEIIADRLLHGAQLSSVARE